MMSLFFSIALCAKGSVLSFVAHADDDLYFINPAIDEAIRAGHCVQTVVTTAGYFGNPDNTQRVAGLQAAYAHMAGKKNEWQSRVVMLAGKPVQRFVLTADPRIVLSFMNLPCSAHDQLSAAPFRSLHQIYSDGGRTETTTAAAKTTYDKTQWRDVYHAVIIEMQAQTIYTLEPDSTYPVRLNKPSGEGSHPDHVFVSKTVADAVKHYGKPISVHYFLDYPLYEHPINLNADQGQRKHAAMQAYCQSDTTACNSVKPNTLCENTTELPWGEAWLCRQRKRVVLMNAEPKKIME